MDPGGGRLRRLVTTESRPFESTRALKSRIRETSRYVELERLAIRPQGAFSTSVVGNNPSIQDQRKKLEVLCETADSIWGRRSCPIRSDSE